MIGNAPRKREYTATHSQTEALTHIISYDTSWLKALALPKLNSGPTTERSTIFHEQETFAIKTMEHSESRTWLRKHYLQRITQTRVSIAAASISFTSNDNG